MLNRSLVGLPTLKCIGTGWRSRILCLYPNGIMTCVRLDMIYQCSNSHASRQLQNGVRSSCCAFYFDRSRFGTALDYPPFFAYFEKLMSIPASWIDPLIVDLNNLNYNSWSVVVYQRSTVILTELVLGLVLLKYIFHCFLVTNC